MNEDIEWPDEASTPAQDDFRLFRPEMVFEEPDEGDVILNKCFSADKEWGPYDGYYVRLEKAEFPWAQGKGTAPYFFTSEMNSFVDMEMINLAQILQFRSEDSTKKFWLVPFASRSLGTSGYNLYTNSSSRDLSAVRAYATTVSKMAIAIREEP